MKNKINKNTMKNKINKNTMKNITENTKFTLTLKQLKQLVKESNHSNWFGIDVSLDTSLLEYGFIMRNISDEEYEVIYLDGHYGDEGLKPYHSFITTDDIIEMGREYIDDFKNIIGLENENDWFEYDYNDANRIMDLKTVLSFEDIFGTPYEGDMSINKVARILNMSVNELKEELLR